LILVSVRQPRSSACRRHRATTTAAIAAAIALGLLFLTSASGMVQSDASTFAPAQTGTASSSISAASSPYLCTAYSACSSSGYSDGGYGAASGTSYWGMDPGHNCTNYAAYRLVQNGVDASYLQGQGNAWEWAGQAQAHGVTVNSTPAVGAIAYWDANA